MSSFDYLSNYKTAQISENDNCQNETGCNSKNEKNNVSVSLLQEYILEPIKNVTKEIGQGISTSLNAAFMSAIAEPGRAVAQIVDHTTSNKFKLKDKVSEGVSFLGAGPDESGEFASFKWHIQQLSGAVGMMLPFMTVRYGIKNVSEKVSKLFSTTNHNEVALGNNLTQWGSANNFKFYDKEFLAFAGKEGILSGSTGAVYGYALSPGEDKHIGTEKFWHDRQKNALADAAVFATLGLTSPFTGRILNSAANKTDLIAKDNIVSNLLRSPFAAGMLAGVPAGYLSAHIEAIKEGKQESLTWSDIGKSIYGMSMVGGVLAQTHWLTSKWQNNKFKSAQDQIGNKPEEQLSTQRNNVAETKDSSKVLDIFSSKPGVNHGLAGIWYGYFGTEMPVLDRIFQLKDKGLREDNLIAFIESNPAKREQAKDTVKELILEGASAKQLDQIIPYLELKDVLDARRLDYLYKLVDGGLNLYHIKSFLERENKDARKQMLEKLIDRQLSAGQLSSENLRSYEELLQHFAGEAKVPDYLMGLVNDGLRLMDITEFVTSDHFKQLLAPEIKERVDILKELVEQKANKEQLASDQLSGYMKLRQIFGKDSAVPNYLFSLAKDGYLLNHHASMILQDTTGRFKTLTEYFVERNAVVSVFDTWEMKNYDDFVEHLRDHQAAKEYWVDQAILGRIRFRDLQEFLSWNAEEKIPLLAEWAKKQVDPAQLKDMEDLSSSYLQLQNILGKDSPYLEALFKMCAQDLKMYNLVGSLENSPANVASLKKLFLEDAQGSLKSSVSANQLNQFGIYLELQKLFGADSKELESLWKMADTGLNLYSIQEFMSETPKGSNSTDSQQKRELIGRLIAKGHETNKFDKEFLNAYETLENIFGKESQVPDYLMQLHARGRDLNSLAGAMRSYGKVLQDIVRSLVASEAKLEEFSPEKLSKRMLQGAVSIPEVMPTAPTYNGMRAIHYEAKDRYFSVEDGLGSVLQAVKPSVYRIVTTKSAFDAKNFDVSSGSGFMVENGRLLTAYHVIEGAKNIYVVSEDGKAYKAKLQEQSWPEKDVAAIEIIDPPKDIEFKSSTIVGAEKQLSKDDPLYLLGHPNGDPRVNISQLKVRGIQPLVELREESKQPAKNFKTATESWLIPDSASGIPIYGSDKISALHLVHGSSESRTVETKAGTSDKKFVQVPIESLYTPTIAVETSGRSVGGFSGGPIANKNGEIVGVIIQGNDSNIVTWFTPIDKQYLSTSHPDYLSSSAKQQPSTFLSFDLNLKSIGLSSLLMGLSRQNRLGNGVSIPIPWALQKLDIAKPDSSDASGVGTSSGKPK